MRCKYSLIINVLQFTSSFSKLTKTLITSRFPYLHHHLHIHFGNYPKSLLYLAFINLHLHLHIHLNEDVNFRSNSNFQPFTSHFTSHPK